MFGSQSLNSHSWDKTLNWSKILKYISENCNMICAYNVKSPTLGIFKPTPVSNDFNLFFSQAISWSLLTIRITDDQFESQMTNSIGILIVIVNSA